MKITLSCWVIKKDQMLKCGIFLIMLMGMHFINELSLTDVSSCEAGHRSVSKWVSRSGVV